MSGAGTQNINGVYAKVPNSENAEIGYAGFQEQQLIRTWKSLNGSFQIYHFTTKNGGYWKISDNNPLRYFYKGPGDSTAVTEWIYNTSDGGTKPDPNIACFKGRNVAHYERKYI